MPNYVSIRRSYALRGLVVLLAASTAVWVVARVGKWATVQRLTARIGAADDATAGRLVKELAAFGSSSYPSLLAATRSPRSAVALAARREVDLLVDHWQQQAFLHPASFSLAGEALPLARAFEDQSPEMSASGKRWARKVLIALLELAQQQDLDERVAMMQTCDNVLTSLAITDTPPELEPDVDYRMTLAAPAPETAESLFAQLPPKVDLSPPVEEPPVATKPVTPDLLALEEMPLADEPEEESPLEVWNPSWTIDQMPELQAQGPSRVRARSASTRIQPPAVPADAATPGSDLELLVQLATGDEAVQSAAAAALKQRGFGLVTPLDARMITSASAADRLALVNAVFASPRLEANAWLWLLANDPAGEVRAAAVAAISTSASRELLARVLDLAIRDTDPRVAGQAETLRQLLR